MKKRRSLLFGLGILVALSVTTPAVAAEIDGKIPVVTDVSVNTGGDADADLIPGSGENAGSAGDDSDGTVGRTGEDGSDTGVPDAQAETEVVEYTWVQGTGEQEGKWILQSVSGDAAAPAQKGFYIISDHIYWIGDDGVLLSGMAEVKDADDTVNNVAELAAGKYYFQSEGTNPQDSGDGLGAMVTSDWVKETADGADRWYWSGEDGKIDSSKAGWQEIDGKWYELENDGTVKAYTAGWYQVSENRWLSLNNDRIAESGKNGWMNINGTWYCLDGNGRVEAKNGWESVSNIWLYAENGKGSIKTGWQNINGCWLYLNNDGSRNAGYTGLQTINGSMYFLDANGALQKGVHKIGGKTYYFDANTGIGRVYGTGENGWKKINGNWYWFEKGNAATGWRKISNKWYYMDPSTSIMKTGFFTAADGRKYYCDGNGVMVGGGWHKLGSKWYYMQNSGAITTGWIRPNGKTWYYLDPGDGAMKTGFYTVKGATYYSNASGAMVTGWIRPDGKTWYYMSGSGAMHKGWIKLKSTWYYLDPGTGAMKTGWYTVGGKKYYSYSNGAMAVNRWIDGYYYVGSSGAMAVNSWINGYWVGSDGRWVPGYRSTEVLAATAADGKWVRNGSNWNYVENNGNKVTGWKYIGGYKYYFDGNGNLQQDVDSIIGKQSSYKITLNRVKCQIMVYAKDQTGKYCIPVKSIVCSVGLPGTPTPTGTFRIEAKTGTAANSGLVTLMGPSWGKWGSLVTYYKGLGIFFHSVACSSSNATYTLPASQYNLLGYPASHGCIRLCVRDAKWIWTNCPVGTTVEVSDNAYMPFDKPASIRIPAGQSWDPTDPDVRR